MTDHIGFLVSDVARLLRKRLDAQTRDLAVTGAQWRVLILIARNPGVRQAVVAEMLDVEPITTCRMVDRLEQAGMVERRRDPEDRRAWRLFLTDAATPLLDSLHERGTVLINDALNSLTTEEQDTLGRLLARVRDNLGEEPLSDQRSASHG